MLFPVDLAELRQRHYAGEIPTDELEQLGVDELHALALDEALYWPLDRDTPAIAAYMARR